MAAQDNTGDMKLDPKYDDYDYPVVAPVPQSGHPGHLTDQQQAQVHQLRLMLEAQGQTKRLDTLTLVRFLPLSLIPRLSITRYLSAFHRPPYTELALGDVADDDNDDNDDDERLTLSPTTS